MSVEFIKKYIRDVPDFPKPGILFRDITPLLGEPPAFKRVIDLISERVKKLSAEVVVGIESRGFIFGAPVSMNLNLPFVPVRKPGKLPARKMSVEYSLEYGSGQLDIHADAFPANKKVVLIDDLLATGGTAQGSAKLVELIGGKVVGFMFVVELGFLEGRKKLDGYHVDSLINY